LAEWDFSFTQFKVCEILFYFWIANKLLNDSFGSMNIIIFTFSIFLVGSLDMRKKWIGLDFDKKNIIENSSHPILEILKNALELFKWCFWNHFSTNFKAFCCKMLKNDALKIYTWPNSNNPFKAFKPSQLKTQLNSHHSKSKSNVCNFLLIEHYANNGFNFFIKSLLIRKRKNMINKLNFPIAILEAYRGTKK
jgi:hypothetical protein